MAERSWPKSILNDSKSDWESICRIFSLIQMSVFCRKVKSCKMFVMMDLNNQKVEINLEPLFKDP